MEQEDFDALTELEELDLYDNRLKNVGDAFNSLSHLTWVSCRCCIAGVARTDRPTGPLIFLSTTSSMFRTHLLISHLSGLSISCRTEFLTSRDLRALDRLFAVLSSEAIRSGYMDPQIDESDVILMDMLHRK